MHNDIKASAQLPILTYPKLPRTWPARLFDVRTLPSYIRHPIHYFELFWDSGVWNTLVENTNAYAQYKEAQSKTKKGRWWKVITLYEMRIFIALLIYISIIGASNIKSFWINRTKDEMITIHKPMEFMTFYRFQQIKRYFHVSPPPTSAKLPTNQWYTKLEPLASLLRTKFKAYVVLS